MNKILIGIIIVLTLCILGIVHKKANTLEHRIEGRSEKAMETGSLSSCLSLPIIEETPYERAGEQMMRTTYPRDTCLQGYILATNDKNTCEHMTDSGRKEYCYMRVAEVYSDMSWCDKLDPHTGIYWKSSVLCRAMVTLRIEECSPFDAPEWNPPRFTYSPKTDCILEIVKRTHDYSLCEKITGPSYMSFDTDGDRNNCLKYAACNMSDKREEVCALMTYPKNTIPQIKKQCLTETWSCPEVPERVQ